MGTFGSFGRFELYSITFENLDRNRQEDLKTITLNVPRKIEHLYERDEKEKIPIGVPLSLIGPSRPCSPFDRLYIVFGDLVKSPWVWRVDYDDERKAGLVNKPVIDYVDDPESDSCARVCYDLISKAVDAKLRFNYEDNVNGRALRIKEGEIYATTKGVSCTKRVLRSFGPCETSILKKESRWCRNGGHEEVLPKQPINLDRSKLGLPLGTVLHVTVNLKYYLVPFEHPKKGEIPPTGEISSTHLFPVPNSPDILIKDFDLDTGGVPGPKLVLKVTWSDKLLSKRATLFSEALRECASKYSPEEVGALTKIPAASVHPSIK